MASEESGPSRRQNGEAGAESGSLRDLMRRTWEMELLISGAVVFALLQIPARLDAGFDLLDPHLSRALGLLPMLGYTYLKLITYTLVGTFILHLAARGYWIGLIGLDSIFPGGIRWQRLDSGPIYRDLQRSTMPTVRRLIAAADRFCSSIFSFAFVVVFNFAFSIVLSVPVVVLAYVLSQRFFEGAAVVGLFLGVWLVLLGPQILFGLLDRFFGKRLAPDGGLARVTRRVLGFYSRLLLSPLHVPILATFSTNVRKSIVYPVFYGLLLSMLALFLIKDVIGRGDALRFSSYVWAPDEAGEQAVEPRHYEELRAGRPAPRTSPTIQSVVVDGPYLRVFLPYRPERDNRVLAGLCEGGPLRGEGLRLLTRRRRLEPDARSAEALACVSRLFEVAIDGEPVASPDYVFYRHPESDQRGLLALPAVGELEPGRHLLTVEKRPPREDPDGEASPSRTYSVPSWR